MDFNSALINDLGPFRTGEISWLEYQERLDTFFDEHHVWSDERKKDICVSMLDTKTLKILKNIILPQAIQDVDYDTVVAKLEFHFYPKLTRAHYMFKFRHRKQRNLENFFQYVAALRKLITNCCYYDSENELKVQIIRGVRDEDLRMQFFERKQISLTQVFEIGLTYDRARRLKAAPHPRNHKARINRDKTCFRCKESILRKHKNEACPFEWALCEHCHVKGHISLACKYKDLACSFCNQVGHIARICAKKINSRKPRQLTISELHGENKENEWTLLAAGLRINITEDELRTYFGKYGELKSLKMKTDSDTNKFNGSAEICYKYIKSHKKVLRIKQHML